MTREEIINASLNYAKENHLQVDNDFQNVINNIAIKAFKAGVDWANERVKKNKRFVFGRNDPDLNDYLSIFI